MRSVEKLEGLDDIRALKEHYKNIIDFLPDATFIIDLEGRIRAWNPAMETLTGVKAESVIGKSNYAYSEPFYGENKPILIDLVLDPQEEAEKDYLNFERDEDTIIGEVFVTHLREGGAYLWAKARPLYNSQGKVIGAIEIIRDISEYKRIESKLRKSKKELKERVKELKCLFKIIKLVKNPNNAVGDILVDTLEIVQRCWKYPELTCTRIEYGSYRYETSNYKKTPWVISSRVLIRNKELRLRVHNLEEKVFFKEEKALIKRITETLKAVFEFKTDLIF